MASNAAGNAVVRNNIVALRISECDPKGFFEQTISQEFGDVECAVSVVCIGLHKCYVYCTREGPAIQVETDDHS